MSNIALLDISEAEKLKQWWLMFGRTPCMRPILCLHSTLFLVDFGEGECSCSCSSCDKGEQGQHLVRLTWSGNAIKANNDVLKIHLS